MVSAKLVAWVTSEIDKKRNVSNNEYDKLSQLTIVIPSFSRHDYLARQLVLWAFTKVSVVIVDGSSEPLNSTLVNLISNIDNISYKHIVGSYTFRINESLGLIKTPYAMCLADDDIFLKEGLSKAIDKLEQNSDVIACMGQLLGVDYDKQKMEGYYFPYGSSLKEYQVNIEDVVKRIKFAMSGYRTATSYAVYRTAIFKDLWTTIDASSCLEATEYEHALITYTLGKLITVEDIYWIRSHECEPVDSVIDGTRATTFHVWWSGKEFEKEREDFVCRLAMKLFLESGLSEDASKRVVFDVVDYIVNYNHTGLMNKTVFFILMTKVMNIVKYFSWFDSLIKKVRSTGFGINVRKKIRSLIRGSKVSLMETDRKDLNKITVKELQYTLLIIDGFHAAR